MTLSLVDQSLIAAAVKHAVKTHSLETAVPEHRSCLAAALATYYALSLHGVIASLQAGSCIWRVRPEGVEPGAWGWEYRHSDLLESLAARRWLCMHAWVAIPGSMEIVDMCTGHFKRLCEEDGCEWTVDDPPPFIWHRGLDVMNRYKAFYMPDPDAIDFCVGAISDGAGVNAPVLLAAVDFALGKKGSRQL
jgi:hypothetical protein